MQRIKRRQLIYEAVQEEIKSYIIEKALKPGDALPTEAELAQMLGVGRNSVREAVKSLETLGIVESRVGAGIYVSDFSFDPLLANLAYGFMFNLKKLTDILEVRYRLESSMVDRAIEASTPEQLQRLHEIVEEMRVSAESGKYSAEADRAFHQTLWEKVDNEILSQILDIFWVVYNQALKHHVIQEPFDPVSSYEGHAEILRILEQRDAEALCNAMLHHYEGTEQLLNAPVRIGKNGQRTNS
ncbi:MAG: FadR family transcriptional regulator [Anaerolineae bacterium]|nr:FadR family transcriptional regulator [Anaerolineae bacterium]